MHSPRPEAAEDLIWKPAGELQAMLRAGEVSSEEITAAYLDQIERVNPQVNVIVSQLPRAEALAAAREADAAIRNGDELGPLHGLPTAVKDLTDVAGLPTAFGCEAFRDAPPADRDALVVSRLREAGALVIGKTATAEFGVGTLTFSALNGVTRNPYDLSRHAGGSSGSAAAVAAGMLPFADGTDSGGSLRYSAAFCNVVGVRTSAGRIPFDGGGSGWSPHSVLGPMTRNSSDALRFLSAVSGPSPQSPISLDAEPESFGTARPVDLSEVRIAWSDDAGGLPVDPAVRAVHRAFRARLEDLGCTVVDAEPDFSGVDETWEVIEMFGFFSKGHEVIAGREHLFRADYVRNVHQGRDTSATELARAFAHRTQIYRSTAAFMEQFDLFVTPATPLPAPPAELEWPEQIDGRRFERYFEWQRLACRLTATSHPVVVTPTGLDIDGLPVGVQVMGRSRDELGLLSITAAIEEALGTTLRVPDLSAIG